MKTKLHTSHIALRKGLWIYMALSVMLLLGCSYPRIGPILPSPTVRISSLPPQGLYEGCTPDTDAHCYDHLEQMARAGFKYVLNYGQMYFTAEEDLEYAARAESVGIKIIWAINNPAFWNGSNLVTKFSRLGATCECTNNAGFIRYMVNLVKSLPATWGYYIGDEVSRVDHDRVQVYSSLVKQTDPSHPRLFVGEGTADGARVAPFADTADVLGADYYPVGAVGLTIPGIADAAHATQSIADKHDIRSVMVLQAFSWAEYPKSQWSCSPFPSCASYPTENEMRQMRDLALSNAHPEFVLWYSYFDIFRSPGSGQHWSNLVKAAGATAQA